MREASNPGPLHTRQARRLERSHRGGLESTQVDSSEEILDRPNRGRHVVPRILTSGTVGEPETTVPASSQALIAVGIADVDAPPTIVDALEEDLAMTTGEIEVVGDASEPMATRLATHHELRDAGVVMPLFQPPLLEVFESLDREANILGLHGRRVVLVPQDSDGTPQSIQDVRTEDDASLVVRPEEFNLGVGEAENPCPPRFLRRVPGGGSQVPPTLPVSTIPPSISASFEDSSSRTRGNPYVRVCF